MNKLFKRAWIAVGFTVLLAVSPAAAQTPVTQCGTTISTAGQYQLVGDLVCAADGVIISADNVDLDLNGYTVSIAFNLGGPYAGIRIAPPSPQWARHCYQERQRKFRREQRRQIE
ncbi:MAG: hypothetical protein HY695_27645 [Deltaproteobacteria bacterium]|nr:hypothetical protein [Deltaproteobacteria bacterium]